MYMIFNGSIENQYLSLNAIFVVYLHFKKKLIEQNNMCSTVSVNMYAIPPHPGVLTLKR